MNRPQRPVRLGPRDIVWERHEDGTLRIRSAHALPAWPRRLTDYLVHWAEKTPDRVLFAQRDAGGGWRTLTYAQAWDGARRIAAALLARGLSAERPLAVLSGNDIEHALLELGALTAGIPYAPVSPAYSLMSTDHGKLRHVMALVTPGLVYAADGGAFARAIAAAVPADVELAVGRNPPPGRAVTSFDSLLAAEPGPAVEAAHDAVGPDTIAKFLFTSGSTGMPKGVINTQRMWCSNQEMLRWAFAFFRDEPPVLVDWAPWHHTAAGNHDFGLVIANGGSYYIDEGKPLPNMIEATVRNLREIAPTWYFNVPRGYEALLPYLRADEALRRNFFSRLKLLWFAGAGIAQHVFDEIRELAFRTCGESIAFLTGLGSTETAPYAMGRMWVSDDATNMGLPPPGVEMKLVPLGDKYEMRLKGPNITPGYWRQPALTAQAFDEDGWYRLGDAFRLADPEDPGQGLLFAGRIAEDFKLSTGTWVHVGPLRAATVAHFAPYVRDAVITGAECDWAGALLIPELERCRALAELPADAAPAAVVAHPGVRAEFDRRLAALRALRLGSSQVVHRVMLLAEPPSLDAGEVTDKGSINQRAVLGRRADKVAALHATPAGSEVIGD